MINKSSIRTWSRLGARGTYGQAALHLPEIDNTMVACTADLYLHSGLERFKKNYPDRLYNVGIAEQNLLGIAGGLAKEGFNPFVSTFAAFAVSRALDQVRINMGYMELPIKLFGLTSGFSAGVLGATHMNLEDLAIMRAIPNITVISPADTTEIFKATIALANFNKPVYVRLIDDATLPVVYQEDYEFEIGKAITIKEGNDIAIVATGTMVAAGLKVATMLEENDISAKVINMHTIKPLDIDMLDSLLKYRAIITLEEHSKIGGLGGSVSEHFIQYASHPPVLKIGAEDVFFRAGTYPYLLSEAGLTPEIIYEKIKKFMEENIS